MHNSFWPHAIPLKVNGRIEKTLFDHSLHYNHARKPLSSISMSYEIALLIRFKVFAALDF